MLGCLKAFDKASNTIPQMEHRKKKIVLHLKFFVLFKMMMQLPKSIYKPSCSVYHK